MGNNLVLVGLINISLDRDLVNMVYTLIVFIVSYSSLYLKKE